MHAGKNYTTHNPHMLHEHHVGYAQIGYDRKSFYHRYPLLNEFKHIHIHNFGFTAGNPAALAHSHSPHFLQHSRQLFSATPQNPISVNSALPAQNIV